MKKKLLGFILACISAMSYSVDEVDSDLGEIINFRQYSESFASSGQPCLPAWMRISLARCWLCKN